MEPEITATVEWKLNHVVDAIIRADDGIVSEGEGASAYSFNRRLTILVERWEDRIETEGMGWSDGALEHRSAPEERLQNLSEEGPNIPVPDLEDDTNRHPVDPAIAQRIEAIAAAEKPGVPVGKLSFNDTLETVLEAWNEYGTELDAGWNPDHRIP